MEIMDSPEQLAASMQQEPTPTTQETPQQESQPVEQVATPEVTPEPTQQAPTVPSPTQETTAQPETHEHCLPRCAKCFPAGQNFQLWQVLSPQAFTQISFTHRFSANITHAHRNTARVSRYPRANSRDACRV